MALDTGIMAQVLDMDYDDLKQLNSFVVATIKQQRAERNAKAALIAKATLKAGDKVVLSGLSPKSLNGTFATIEHIAKTRAHIRHETRGLVTVPLVCVTKVEDEQ